ncbi:MAG: hypothetical protein ABSH13_21565 [Candidatus Acidiferrum sp.]|jgi:hypothetical protein
MRPFLLVCWFLATQLSASATCNTSPDLSASVPAFRVQQASRIEALLRFGDENGLCFGIEEVDAALLTELADFDIKNSTVQATIKSILGPGHPITTEKHYGVIELRPRSRRATSRNILDFVISKWEANRGELQLVSWLLRIQLATELNPQIKGFGGDARAGDTRDEVGPFNERNVPVRYLLDKIVAQSRGGSSWIVQVNWEELHDFTLFQNRSAWTIVEYEGHKANYATLLNGIAAGLNQKTNADDKRPPGAVR